jgi:hypothetical protein
MIPVFKFYKDAWEYKDRHPGQRIGQAFFNHLRDVRPHLSEVIRATGRDPFYCEWRSPQWDRFITFIQTNWDKKDSN